MNPGSWRRRCAKISRTSSLAAAVALLVSGCEAGLFVNPAPTDVVSLSLGRSATSPAASSIDSLFDLANRLDVRIRREDGAVVLDTTLAYSRASETRVAVELDADESLRTYQVEVELRRDAERLLDGSATPRISRTNLEPVEVLVYPKRPFVSALPADSLPIREVTAVRFAASGGNPAWKTFTWDFGDGSTATGQTASHVYSTEGTYRVTLRAVRTSGEDVASANLVVGTLTGTWVRDAVSGVRHRLEMVQQGSTLSGRWWVLYDPGSPFGNPSDSSFSALRGTVIHRDSIAFSQVGECQRTITAGRVNADLTLIGGSGFFGNSACGGAGGWTFRR